MIRYTLKRFLSLCISLAVASLLIFFVIEIAPGDPASFMLGINAQPDTVAALRAELGLDVPKFKRYLAWAQGMLTGDFGMSYTYRTPVSQMVADRLWVSLPLALFALALSTIIALPAGIYAAARRGKTGDVAVMSATQLGVGDGKRVLNLLRDHVLLEELLHPRRQLALDQRRRRLDSLSRVIKLVEGLEFHAAPRGMGGG